MAAEESPKTIYLRIILTLLPLLVAMLQLQQLIMVLYIAAVWMWYSFHELFQRDAMVVSAWRKGDLCYQCSVYLGCLTPFSYILEPLFLHPFQSLIRTILSGVFDWVEWDQLENVYPNTDHCPRRPYFSLNWPRSPKDSAVFAIFHLFRCVLWSPFQHQILNFSVKLRSEMNDL